MPTLRAPKRIALPPTRPNVGVAVGYQRQLDALIAQMNKSIVYWISAAWRANPPHATMAADASPAVDLRNAMKKLSRRWLRNFADAAKDMATGFTDKAAGNADKQLKGTLDRAGFSVPFKATPAMNDAFQAVVSENVGLIKSIASQHLGDVERLVASSVQNGRDLGALTDELERRYSLTRNRAAFIARDQNSKATSAMDRARKLSLGITKSKWRHSGGGHHPRQSHVDADGKIFETAKGCMIDGEYIFPGELPNCGCLGQAVIPGFDDED
jgi:uncharacterized protein with gpF-like domain